MKYFLVILFALPFFAQAQVVLPDKVARFYLERHYTAVTLSEQVEIKTKIISNLNSQIIQKNAIIDAYVNDRAIYEEMLKVKAEEESLIMKDLIKARKEVRKQKTQKKLIIVGAVVLTVILSI